MKKSVFWIEARPIPNLEITAHENKKTVIFVNYTIVGNQDLETLV